MELEDAKDEPARILSVGTVGEALDTRKALFEQHGYAASSVVWPVDLTRTIEEHAPDLVLLYVKPGETWGFEVCADLRLVDPAHELPVILVVAEDAADAIERGLLAGADDVVRVSIGDGELQARFAVQLRNRRHRDSLRTLRTERDHLKVKATVDPLTGVLNRGALEEALLAELNRGTMFAVMFVDLDHFKNINDKYGHDIGDNVLRALGGHLRRTIRSNDIAGRYGGEEFVVCLAGCDNEFAPKIAERHREWIEKLVFPKEGHPEKVTASIGVAVFDPKLPDSSLTSLLKRADSALYQAKHRGRNRVVVASSLRRSFEEEASRTIAQAISRSPTPMAEQQTQGRGAEALEAELVKQLNQGSSALPVIPAVAMAALRMANTPNVDISKLAALLERDPYTAARFLAVANSPMYYRGFRIASTRDALMRMGIGQGREILANIAHSVALPKYNELLEKHSEYANLAARSALAVSQEMRWHYEPAYLCGLLHNLGEARVLRILASLPTPAEGMRVIHELVERYHAHAGAALAEKWNLHSDIVQACALHHEEAHRESPPVRMAMLSDVFAKLAMRGRRDATEEEAESWRKLGITDEQAQAIMRAVRS
ncbi:MAG: pleD 3 [Myxococcaceae bacterium]|nr:pleD 3 [Myxococcaceae bacterium]